MTEIEVELRGPLSVSDYNRILIFFNKNAEFIEKKERVLIDYSTFMKEQGIRERNLDIRARITNGVPEMIIKKGKWKGSDKREEISVKMNTGEFSNLISAFAALGYRKGVLCTRNIILYKYKEVEFSLVEVPDHSYFFEAEKKTKNKELCGLIKDEITQVCELLGLRLFNDDEFFSYIERLNTEANKIYDYDEQGINDLDKIHV